MASHKMANSNQHMHTLTHAFSFCLTGLFIWS